jgi:hypothetical protein
VYRRLEIPIIFRKLAHLLSASSPMFIFLSRRLAVLFRAKDCLRERSRRRFRIPFTVTTWTEVLATEHRGESEKAIWRTFEAGNLRVRRVKYEPGYTADHWCTRGHVVLIFGGRTSYATEYGRQFTLRSGMSYQLASNAEAHKSSTRLGATLFIAD